MIEKKGKNKVIIIAFILMILGTIITTMGVSFSFFAYSRGSKVNKVVTGNLEFSMLDGESVLLTNAYPQSDRDGLNNTPYTFTVNNTSSEGITISYYLSLLTSNDDSSKSYFKNNQIKYNLTKNGIEVVSPRLLSSIDGFNVDSSKGDGVVLDNQEITAKSTDYYELRIWIDENVEYTGEIDENGLMTSTNQYEYSLKVRINARNKVDDGSGDINPIKSVSTLTTGPNINSIISELSGGTITKAIKMAYSIPNGVTTKVISTPDSEVETLVWYDNGTIYVYSDGKITMNSNSSAMFRNYRQLEDISALANWDASNVTDMSFMFMCCEKIIDLSSLTNWNISKVTDMNNMFFECRSLTNLSSLANWDTSKVTDMNCIFMSCYNLNNISSLANWDVSNVTNMTSMFYGCSGLVDIGALTNWNTSKVTTMKYIFRSTGITNLSALINWNTSKVTDMSYMFYVCIELSDISGLANWDVSNVRDMSWMFHSQKIMDLSPLEHWNVSSIANTNQMFGNILSTVQKPSWYK